MTEDKADRRGADDDPVPGSSAGSTAGAKTGAKTGGTPSRAEADPQLPPYRSRKGDPAAPEPIARDTHPEQPAIPVAGQGPGEPS